MDESEWSEAIAAVAKTNRLGAFLAKLLASDNHNEILNYTRVFNSAADWFGSAYMGAETLLDAPIEMQAHIGSNKNYQKGLNLLAYFGRTLYRKELYTPSSVFRIHDVRDLHPEIKEGDEILITPHKSCLSYTDDPLIEIPARDEGLCDILFRLHAEPSAVVWTYKTGKALTADVPAIVDALGLPSINSVLDYELGNDRLSKERQKLIWSVHGVSVAPFEQEHEIILYHKNMEPFKAVVEKVIQYGGH